jgi:hypothetical protein
MRLAPRPRIAWKHGCTGVPLCDRDARGTPEGRGADGSIGAIGPPCRGPHTALPAQVPRGLARWLAVAVHGSSGQGWRG